MRCIATLCVATVFLVRAEGTDASIATQLAKLVADDRAASDLFGISVAISDGIAVVGAYADDENSPESGTAFVFEMTSSNGTSVWTNVAKLNTHILRAHLFFLEHPTPNTQKIRKKKGKHVTPFIYRARACKTGVRTRASAWRTGSTRRRRFLRRVARGDMGRFAFSLARSSSNAFHDHRRDDAEGLVEASIGKRRADDRGSSSLSSSSSSSGANDGNPFVRTASYPFRATSLFVRRVHGTFDASFLRYLCIVHMGFIGFFRMVTEVILLPMAETVLNLSAAEVQRIATVIMFPGVLQPTFAIISDIKPWFGYHKRPYLFVGGCLGLFASTRLATGTFEGKEVDFVVAIMCVYFSVVILGCLADGKRAELMHKNPQTGGDLVAYSVALEVVGQILGLAVGYIALQNEKYTLVYYFAIPAVVASIISTLLGELPEEKVKYSWNLLAFKVKVKYRQILLAGMLMVVGIGFVYMQTIELVDEGMLKATVIMNFILGLCIIVMCKSLLPKFSANVIVYAFLERALSIRFQYAVNYWYTLPEDCVPGGPNFDYVYFNIINGFVALTFSGLGIWMFQEAFSTGRLRRIFWWSSGTRCIGSLCDLFVVTRLNLKMGIPDQLAYTLGNSVLEAMVFMLSVMPFAILISKLVIDGTESTLLAITSGASILGGLMASSLGSLAIEYSGIKTNIEDPNQSCDWSNLENLIIICGILSPLLCVPLTLVLIPNVLSTATFEMDHYSGEVLAITNEDGTHDEREMEKHGQIL